MNTTAANSTTHTPNGTTYRLCTTDDTDLLCRMGASTFRDTFAVCTADDDMERYLAEDFNHDRIASELRRADSTFYLASVDDQPAGYLKINVGEAQTEPMGSEFLEVQRLYVLPEFKRHGMGSEFIRIAFRNAEERGLHQVWLGVWEGNKPAQALYSRMGFSFFSSHTFQVGSDPQTDLIMKTDLNTNHAWRQ